MHARYINPLAQFGYIAFDLCFEQEGIALLRTAAAFPEDVTEAQLLSYANSVWATYCEANELTPEEMAGITVDLPEGMTLGGA